jgi:hypothetical protein
MNIYQHVREKHASRLFPFNILKNIYQHSRDQTNARDHLWRLGTRLQLVRSAQKHHWLIHQRLRKFDRTFGRSRRPSRPSFGVQRTTCGERQVTVWEYWWLYSRTQKKKKKKKKQLNPSASMSIGGFHLRNLRHYVGLLICESPFSRPCHSFYIFSFLIVFLVKFI